MSVDNNTNGSLQNLLKPHAVCYHNTKKKGKEKRLGRRMGRGGMGNGGVGEGVGRETQRNFGKCWNVYYLDYADNM